MDSYFETTVEHLNKDLNLGQVLEFNTKNVSLTFEKVSLNNISGKRLIQSSGTEIRFPPLDFNETATISVILNLSFSETRSFLRIVDDFAIVLDRFIIFTQSIG